jgi:creatinine amidohydrolase
MGRGDRGTRGPLQMGTDWNMAFMFPQEVAAARERNGLVILPIAPVEWHGPHMVMGTDNLLAHAFAAGLARELECPYYPPLFVGTERERSPKQLRSMGFGGDEFIEGMDFPGNAVGSAYFREEVFAALVRDTLRILIESMGFARVVIVNGHGADNQRAVLDRLCGEFNAGAEKLRVMWFYPGFPRSVLAGSIAHAGAEETSLLSAQYEGCVDTSVLPGKGPLRNLDFAIVDGETFDGKPTRGHTVRRKQDPRYNTNAEWGRRTFARALKEVVEQIRSTS